MKKQFYSIQETAERLDSHPNTIRNWIRSGKLEAHQFGKNIKVKEQTIQELIKDSIINTQGSW